MIPNPKIGEVAYPTVCPWERGHDALLVRRQMKRYVRVYVACLTCKKLENRRNEKNKR